MKQNLITAPNGARTFQRYMTASLRIVGLCCLTVLAVVLSSCSQRVPKYARLIKKDAGVVARIDVKQLADKASDGQGDKQTAQFKQLIDQMGLSTEGAKRLKAIADDPAKAGIDLRKPLLVFDEQINGEQGVSMVGALHDSDQFAALLKALSTDLGTTPPTADGDLKVVSMERATLAFDDDWFYFACVDTDTASLTSHIKQRFAAKAEESVASREDFKQLCALKGDAQLMLSGKAWEMLLQQSGEDVNNWLPDNVKLEDFSCLVDLSFDKGAVSLTTKALPLSDAARQWFDKSMEGYGEVSDKLIGYVPDNALFAMALNIDGPKLFEAVRPVLEKQRSDIFSTPDGQQMKNILCALKGDFVLWVDRLGGFGTGAQGSFLAETTQPEAVKSFSQYLFGPLEETGTPGQYQASGGYTGVDKGVWYVSTSQPLSQMTQNASPADKKLFKGHMAAATLNLQRLVADSPLLMGNPYLTNAPTRQLLNNLDCLDIEVKDHTEAVITLRLKDTKRNALQLITEALDSAV